MYGQRIHVVVKMHISIPTASASVKMDLFQITSAMNTAPWEFYNQTLQAK